MTKDELLVDLASKSFVGGLVGNCENIGSPEADGCTKYRQSYREVVGKVCKYITIQIVEVNGEAFYLNEEPVQTI